MERCQNRATRTVAYFNNHTQQMSCSFTTQANKTVIVALYDMESMNSKCATGWTWDMRHACVACNIFVFCQCTHLLDTQRYCQKSKFKSFMNAEPSSPCSSTPRDEAITGCLMIFITCPALLWRRHRETSSLGLAYSQGGWGGLGCGGLG